MEEPYCHGDLDTALTCGWTHTFANNFFFLKFLPCVAWRNKKKKRRELKSKTYYDKD